MRARAAGRVMLLEHEGFSIAAALGMQVPHHVVVRDVQQASALDLDAFPGHRVVVKVVSTRIAHKSDVGGVQIVHRQADVVAETVREMQAQLGDADPEGFLACEYIPHEAGLGGEFLLGMRWTEDFGAVVTLGLGGVHTEFLSRNLAAERDVAILSPGLSSARAIETALAGKVATPLLSASFRGRRPQMSESDLHALLSRALDLAQGAMPHYLTEFEINPFCIGTDGPVALDALGRLASVAPGSVESAPRVPRPIHKLAHLLRPRSIAVVGVSERMNPGRVILKNILEEGFDARAVYVVKPGSDEIEGCRCVPDVASLPSAVDLLVVSVDARQVPDVLEAVVSGRKAESLIVIPGGLDERGGAESSMQRIHAALDASRASEWQGPVVNGGNCLGIRSVPGRYDTLFIPKYKLRYPTGPPAPVAVLSQSGAFAIARASKQPWLNPRYVVTLGNQIDLTLGDYLTYLKEDREIEVFACYVEGFKPLDGRRWLEAARNITAGGRPVILYRAGRTRAGAGAAASHTASIAGDYAVTRELARAAGVLVAESHADFEDLLQLVTLLRAKKVTGLRLGALSNAGFECVSMADATSRFELAQLTPATVVMLEDVLRRSRLRQIVSVRNPLDVTPILHDEPYEEAARALLEDANVDVGVIGCVPLSGRLQTLAAGSGHPEDVAAADSVASRLARLHAESRKAWIAVVDSGPLYDAMAQRLLGSGVPTFRTADRALRLFSDYCAWRLAHPAR
ncbi:MAG: acetate--CoA ligase family protein [Candidatus Latescibacterota bacterium]|nr:MAG: acetate--CoA ligase family protein [Candidatus Latescibacterota bacterium]